MQVSKYLDKFTGFIWALLVIGLSFTSMPWVVRLVGSDTVASPAVLFLLVMILLWFVPYFFRKGTMPKQVLPILIFVILALFSTTLSNFFEIPAFKAIDPLRNQLEAVITLLVGVSFFLIFAIYPAGDRHTLNRTIRWINLGGFLIIAWSLFQAVAWRLPGHYPGWLKDLHGFYSVGPLYRARVTGFALEPSWLAHQLNMLYLPLWLAAVVRRCSVHKLRLGPFIPEDFLLAGGVVTLLLSLSRVGLGSFVLMIAFLFLRFNSWISGKAAKYYLSKKQYTEGRKQKIQRRLSILFFILLLFLYLLILLGIAFGFSKVDPRMADLFAFEFDRPDAVLHYANQLTFASRMVYWQAGWNMFNEHIWLGVGLGNAGFYMPESLDPFAWKLIEIRRLMFREHVLLNVKSLWSRLLAETGIIGFSIFVGWLTMLWKTGRVMAYKQDNQVQTLGLMGIFVLIAFLIEGFSIDSFAIPYLWVSSGLLVAGSRIGVLNE